jgi:hypothetical protein
MLFGGLSQLGIEIFIQRYLNRAEKNNRVPEQKIETNPVLNKKNKKQSGP